jgi:hypothetical protein
VSPRRGAGLATPRWRRRTPSDSGTWSAPSRAGEKLMRAARAEWLAAGAYGMVRPVRRRYPLESLRAMRRDQVEQGKTQLGAERARVAQATCVREQARAARQEQATRAQEARQLEHQRLEHGKVRACDLEQAGHWEQGVQTRARALREVEARAESAQRAAEQAAERARGELARAEAGTQAVERHRDRWRALEVKAEEISDEDQAQDRWTTCWLSPDSSGMKRRE